MFVAGQDSDDPGYVETDPTGRYGRFDEVLGKGAMKTVYRAFDEHQGIEVAWNQTRICDVLRSPEALERLYSEVNLLSTLSHDSIIQYHASWVDTGKRTFNFITEMFTSGTLREYRQRYKRVDIRAVKNWARQILHGLVYLHGHDPPVIHRDLKCDNIFVNGHLGQVKIGDLGLAAVLRGTQPAHSVIGTPEFMAPELYEEEYNELVDVYSFGMCVLEMLSAEYPYSECSNPAQIYKKVTSGKLPEAFYKIKDPEARRFIGRCLANVSLRCSAEELLLDSFLQPVDNEEIQPPRGRICKAASESHVLPQPLCRTSPKKKISTDMKITGKMNADDTIFLRVQIAEKDGNARNICFPFDIVRDTPIDVAHEMVKELEITDRDPVQIAEVIDQEISALVPHWKEENAEDDQPHVYSYGDEEEGSHHPFYYPPSPTFSQQSSFSREPSHVGNSHHGASYHAQDWPPEYDIFPDNDDDDTSSQSSMHYSKYSYVNYNSGGEQGPEPPRPQNRDVLQPPPPAGDQKSTRFCPEACTKADLLATKLQKHSSCVSPEPPPPSDRDRRKPSDGRKLLRNQSLVDMRSQLLHRTLVEELNKRAFKTVGSVENIGYQHPRESSSKVKNKPFHGACKKLGLGWKRS